MITPEEMTGYMIFGVAILAGLVGWIATSMSNRGLEKIIDEDGVRFDTATGEDADRIAANEMKGCGGVAFLILAIVLIVLAAMTAGLPEA